MRCKSKIIVAAGRELEGVPDVIPLLPWGRVTSTKGDFVVDEESYRLMCRAMADHGVDLVIDYEHQSLGGGKAPAAGWIKELIHTEKGISARVEWTEEAAGYLRSREYRYSSPVVLARASDDKAICLQSLALTNTPAIDGMYPIINKDDYFKPEEDDNMELIKQLAALLELPETVTEEDVLTAVKNAVSEVKALKAQCGQQDKLVVNKMLAPLLEVEEDADLATVSAKVLALKSHAGYVPKAEYDAMAEKVSRLEGEDLVGKALKDGKITPAMEGWARQYVLADKDGFAKFVACATPVVSMGQNQQPAAPKAAAPAAARIVCKTLGVSDEDLKTYGGR